MTDKEAIEAAVQTWLHHELVGWHQAEGTRTEGAG